MKKPGANIRAGLNTGQPIPRILFPGLAPGARTISLGGYRAIEPRSRASGLCTSRADRRAALLPVGFSWPPASRRER